MATFRVLAKGDVDAEAALASAVGCPPPPRSLTPPRRPALRPEGLCCPMVRRCRDCPNSAVRVVPARLLLLCLLPSRSRLAPEPIADQAAAGGGVSLLL